MLKQSVLLCLVALGIVQGEPMKPDSSNWWKNSFVYQIYPRSFKDSDGDGIGDLNGITSKLEHLADLGVSGIWISPFYPSPMVDFGYDISNFIDVDPVFGNLADFDRLVTKAKSLGLKVLLDFVPNHSSDKHEWFVKSVKRIPPFDEYYVWVNATVVNGTRLPPNNWLSAFGGSAWEWNPQRGQYYLHQFAVGQPDLNYRNLGVENEMKDVIRFWLKRGVDGFRIDAVNHMYEDPMLRDEPVFHGSNLPAGDYDTLDHVYTKNLHETYLMVKQWRELCDDESPRRDRIFLLTEVYGSNEVVMKYYDYGVDAPLNFVFMGELNKNSKNVDYKRSIDKWFNEVPKDQVPNWVTGNHDQRRVTGRFGVLRADQLSMLAAALPGPAIVYNGDEIGMEDVTISWEDTVDPSGCNAGRERYQYKSRDPERTPFQWDDSTSAGFSRNNKTWLPVHPNYEKLNLAAQKLKPVSHYSVFKNLVALKKVPVMMNGSLETAAIGENLFAVVRRYNYNAVVLIVNLNEFNVTVDARSWLNVPTPLVVRVASAHSGILPGLVFDTTNLQLPGAASIILSFP